ncbi:MAG TPA: YggS family pyridoxal phosphate-dependent enzyme [Ktedonobacterales bacterium]
MGTNVSASNPSSEPAADDLAARIRHVRARVTAAATRAGRDPEDVLIVGASKTVDVERIRAAYELGLKTFGENRVQEARGKIAALHLPLIRWELIGHLQTNKVARAVELFARIQAVDSIHLAQALQQRAEQAQRVLPVLLEVNVADESSKFGLRPEEVVSAARAIAALPHLRPEGLMTVAPLADDPEVARPVFRALRELLARLCDEVPEADWRQLSMGMTDDFEIAIEEGATIVRIGRALFGPRPAV